MSTSRPSSAADASRPGPSTTATAGPQSTDTDSSALPAGLLAISEAMSRAFAEQTAHGIGASFSDDEVERFYSVGYHLVLMGDLIRAKTVLLQVCDLRPGEPRYLRALAVVLRDLGAVDTAASLFQVIDMLEPGNPRNALNLAECWLRSGDASLEAKARSLLAMTVAYCEGQGVTGPVLERAMAMVKLLDRQGEQDATAQRSEGQPSTSSPGA